MPGDPAQVPVGLDDDCLLPCGCRVEHAVLETWAVKKGMLPYSNVNNEGTWNGETGKVC